MKELIYIAIGGAIGALTRYFVSGIAYKYIGIDFPWGTLSVNLIGSFLIGFLYQFFERVVILPETKTLIFIGFLGAFTTFSTYALETLNFLKEGEIRIALYNFLANNIFSILFAFIGMMISKYLIIIIEKGVAR